MRRFESLNHCLPPLATVHAAAAWFCCGIRRSTRKAWTTHLSRHDLEECHGEYEFKVEDCEVSSGGVGRVPMPGFNSYIVSLKFTSSFVKRLCALATVATAQLNHEPRRPRNHLADGPLLEGRSPIRRPL